MFGLHKMDGNLLTNHDSGFQSGLHPTTDWTQLEERRRTFWVAFNVDWYASSRYVNCLFSLMSRGLGNPSKFGLAGVGRRNGLVHMLSPAIAQHHQ